ncbi:LysE family translocator [Maricaulis salignorans]|uniref:Threonine/homoserine/homoserine lactone efflux protein n=1 Tax=Maricaulis salignorans TaxID=144026 RepID=A0A1G9T2J5_9PROT|nr:LysE family translocator [Maricaulis salignorans]SDM41929.1 Threonine/homoserine/homoserine lactone efflux protein [Maricaulis salignorans]
MDMALYTGLVSFVIVMSVTPGPNNLMLMSSSALFGVRATLPTWLGVNLGFNIMLVAAVFGLGTLVARFPWAITLVKFGGAVWLLWMAWLFARAGLATAGPDGKVAAPVRSRPIRSYEAALFQWVNPKALLMTLSSAGAYVALADTAPERAVLMVATFILFGAPCGLLWVFAGGALKRFMADGRSARILNLAIAGILLVTVAMIVLA